MMLTGKKFVPMVLFFCGLCSVVNGSIFGASGPTPTPTFGHATSHFSDWKPPLASSREVTISALRSVVDQAMLNVSRHDAGILAIEAAMESTYRALPKNSDGLLSHSAAGYIVQKYFVQEHRYNVKGIGADPMLKPAELLAVHDANVLQTQAPELVEALLENHRGGRGLTLSDAAAMASAMHGLIIRHGETLLERSIEAAQRVKHLDADIEAYGTKELVTAFHAWQVLLKANHDFYINYAEFEKRLDNPTHIMQEFADVAENVALTRRYQQRNQLNPFKAHTFSTMEMMSMVTDVIESMGYWQDTDCKIMKKALATLDTKRTGRVPLDVLYEQPVFRDENGKLVFRFAESQDNLREIGALDESVASEPKLLISNYVLGPANCYRMASYFTYCCLSECDSLLAEIERSVEGPTAQPEYLLSLVVNISNALDDNPMPISPALANKLDTIAKRHGGVVPLHGRLFAQWLHFAFPLECPYPHVTDKDLAGNSLVTSYLGQKSTAAAEPNRALRSDSDASAEDVDPALTQWTDDESLPLLAEDFSNPSQRFWGFARTCCIEVARFSLLYLLYSWVKTGMWGLKSRTMSKAEAKEAGWESAMDKLA